MTERPKRQTPVWAALMIFVLVIAQPLPGAFAEEMGIVQIEVFTVSGYRITGQMKLSQGTAGKESPVRIYVLDGLKDLEARLTENLPGNPEQARRVATYRILQISETDRARLQQTAVGLARAIHYGIDRHPAMVFNGQAVVYGLTDLNAGLNHYRAWHSP